MNFNYELDVNAYMNHYNEKEKVKRTRGKHVVHM